LLADYEYTEWEPDAGPMSSAALVDIVVSAASDALVDIAGPADTHNPTADGTNRSKPPSAIQSLVLPLLSMLFINSQGEGRHHSSSEAQQHAGNRPPADPNQRIIIAHLMQCWKDNQYVLGHVALARSKECLKLQSMQRIPALPKDEQDTIFREYFPKIDTGNPKKKGWNLNLGPLSWMADTSAQRPVTRLCLDLWMSFFCRSMGAPILMLQAHAVAQTMSVQELFS